MHLVHYRNRHIVTGRCVPNHWHRYAYSYTPTGNVSNIEIDSSYSTYTATYNAANKLASMTSVLSAFDASYDYAGQRIIKNIYSGGPNYFTYDQGGRLLEEMPGTLYTDYIYLNGRLIGVQTNTASGGATALYYVTTDRLGTVRMVSDSSLSIIWGEYLYPYGIEDYTGGGIVQSLSFPGQYLDEPYQGFNYNLNRYYYARWGRYQEPDPIGLAGGLNPYVYANNNPIGVIDPSGLAGAPRGIKVQPQTDAEGSHSTFLRNPSEQVTDYSTWEMNPYTGDWTPTSRFRIFGQPHGGIEPPIYYDQEPGKSGTTAPPKCARPALPNEIPGSPVPVLGPALIPAVPSTPPSFPIFFIYLPLDILFGRGTVG